MEASTRLDGTVPFSKFWDDMVKQNFFGGMGFRDIELFNLALLAKQAWRILQDGTTLSARILEAVYYSSGEFLAAHPGSRPSRIWHSNLGWQGSVATGADPSDRYRYASTPIMSVT